MVVKENLNRKKIVICIKNNLCYIIYYREKLRLTSYKVPRSSSAKLQSHSIAVVLATKGLQEKHNTVEDYSER